MLADPQSVTISDVTTSLPKTRQSETGSAFTAADGTVTISVNHVLGRRFRRTVRIDHSKVTPDPLFPAQNTPYSMSMYMVFDVPRVGYTITEQKAVVDGLLAQLQASSGALITEILGGES